MEAKLAEILKQIEGLKQSEGLATTPRLVAVSKLKPASDVLRLYNVGHRVFGENYVQELVNKAAELPEDIEWHFIGHLQSNKCNLLAKMPQLDMIETVDNQKLATALNKSCSKFRKDPLKILVQVNTSKEETKSGTTMGDCVDLVRFIKESCPALRFCGLMTIGQYHGDPTEDFKKLVDCHKTVCEKFKLDVNDIELSMGMSNDFIEAIKMGSTNVRVGSAIFGARS
eukprot:TRINITY_DN11678_c0_g1_i1.p1 TRINITY_DN11678_c0_g1~~TRINITY_DN11678_c0_g1_i1.p1  ORF type:complete len:227 (-),score=34.70 TRINITY_DN11678_c0_g1_i1:539-1219(-)